MGVEIREVLTKQDLWKWVRFPNKLYKQNPYFIPFLEKAAALRSGLFH